MLAPGGAGVSSLSYPHGSYTRKTAALAAAAEYTCAGSTRAQPVRAYTGPFELTRMTVQDWDGDEFARRAVGMARELIGRFCR